MKLTPDHCPNCGVNFNVAERPLDRRSACAFLHEHLGLTTLLLQVGGGQHPDVEVMVEGTKSVNNPEGNPEVWPRERTSPKFPSVSEAVEEVLQELPPVAWEW